MVWMFKLLMSGPWAAEDVDVVHAEALPGCRPADFEEHRDAVAADVDAGHRRAYGDDARRATIRPRRSSTKSALQRSTMR